MKKNRVLAFALAVCLVAILAFGSLAFFTDSERASNKFMTASSDDPDKLLFDVDLYETDVDNDGDKRANTYSNILPGSVLSKDPTVKNTGLYGQYVRLVITIDCASQWQAACADHNIEDLEDIFGGINSKWERKSEEADLANNTLTYTYYLNHVLNPDETSTIFETVTIPKEFTIEDMNTLTEFNMYIVAEAIQSDNNGTNAVEAFENWE